MNEMSPSPFAVSGTYDTRGVCQVRGLDSRMNACFTKCAAHAYITCDVMRCR